MHKILKKLISFNIYKMLQVTDEALAKNYVHRIKINKTDNKLVLWIK